MYEAPETEVLVLSFKESILNNISVTNYESGTPWNEEEI